MATTRIKDITTAASTFSSDDFVAIDGATSGTRKMAKADLITEVSSGVSGTYLEESNNLSDVASKDTSKLNLEVPDVGTAPNEVPMNGQLGTMAYQSAEAVSVDKLEVTDKVDGNLGINTPASSTHALDVLGSVNCSSAIYAEDVVVNGTTPTVTLNDTDGDANAAAAYVQFQQGGTGIGKIGDIASGRSAMMVTSDSGKELMFFTDGQNASSATPAITVDTSQRVGISTSSPTGPLTVRVGADKNLVVNSQYSGASLEAANDAYTANVPLALYGAPIRLLNGNVEVSSGNVVMTGGGGIDFGAVASGSGTPTPTVGGLLDDYEAGIHTATLTPQTSGSITLNSSNDSVSYTKVGRVVTVTGALVVSAVSSPTGDFVKLSLPFVVGNHAENSGDFAAPIFLMNAANSINSYSMIAIEGDSFLRIYRSTSASVSSSNSASDFSGNEVVYFSCTYQTT